MRVSIWPQFASNHSADFTIVGAFPDSDSAMKAAEVVREAVVSMVDWYSTHPAIKEAVIYGRQTEPTGAELEVSRKFGIPAYRALDWLAEYDGDGRAFDTSQTVVLYNNLVFVTTENNGWAGPTLFDGLLNKLTHSVFMGVEDLFELLVSLTWLAPDENTAVTLGNLCRRYTRAPAFHNGQGSSWIIPYLRDQPDGESLLKDYQIHMTRRRAEMDWQHAWHQEHKPEEWKNEGYQAMLNDLNAIEKLDSMRDNRLTQKIREAVVAIFDGENNGVTVEGRRVTLRRMLFRNPATGLPAIIKWLTEQGCSAIQYEFEQIRLKS